MYKLFGTQKAIHVCRLSQQKTSFMLINKQSIKKAMNELRPNTFKLWLYICGNKDHYEFALSNADVKDFCNMSRNTYSDAVNELITKGYLQEYTLQKGKHGYIFWEGGAEQMKEANNID